MISHSQSLLVFPYPFENGNRFLRTTLAAEELGTPLSFSYQVRS
jgi:hypothetical protein